MVPWKLGDIIAHSVELNALHLPKDATYDRKIGLFQWTAVQCKDYVSILARDAATNLKSKYDIQFHVNVSNLHPDISSNHQLNLINCRTLTVGFILLFGQ